MIHEVSGDILLTKAQAIAHGIAPNDHFDQGLAAALHEKWPTMVKDFRHYAHQAHPKPGELWTWGGFSVRVFNLMTQEGEHLQGGKPGKARASNVNHCLKRLRHELEKAERLISVEDVSFNAVKAEAQETAEAVEPGPPAYYIAPPGIPEAKLQRIKFEVVEEKETPVVDSEKPVAGSFDPGKFEMKLTINAYYAGPDKVAESKTTDDSGNKPADGAQKTKGEV